MKPMPRMNDTGIRIRSHGFELWRQKEGALKARITLDEIATATELNVSTIRKLVAEPNTELYGSAVGPMLKVAQYFDVPLDGLIYTVAPEAP